ncbi:MAG: thioredoxin family protein, partial [Chloroflexi bacterium]|nr:thioredoxin family protein [Chloroflexota bacterium]
MAKKSTRRNAVTPSQAAPKLPAGNMIMMVGVTVVLLLVAIALGFYATGQGSSGGQTASAAMVSATSSNAVEQIPSSNQITSLPAASDSHAGGSMAISTGWDKHEPEALAAAEKGSLGEPALIWFGAVWCEVCQSIKPTVDSLEKQYAGKVKIVHMDVDRTSPAVIEKYRVRGTPTFALYDKNGKQVQSFVGWPGTSS